jgi:5-(carboxyamino)imidazole ribonucleotide mutase
MGSSSDWPTMSKAIDVLQHFGLPHEVQVLSAHRMPDEMFGFAESARERGLRAIIAGAGGAAHLPGMLAAKTTVPVLGVPVASRHLGGQDSGRRGDQCRTVRSRIAGEWRRRTRACT